MATQYKTKCPHCGAQFKISEQHLKQAGGKVRCGSCLEIFKATDHLVDRPAAKPAAPATKPPARKPAAQPAKPAKPAAGPEARKPAQRWTLDDNAEPPAPAEPKKKQSAEKTPPRDNNTGVSLGELELSESFLSLGEENDGELREESFSDMSGAARNNMSGDGDEAWAKALLEELEEEDKHPPPPPGNAADRKKPAKASPPPAATRQSDTDDLDAALAQLGDDDPEASLDALFEETTETPSGEPREDRGPFNLFDDDDDQDSGLTDFAMPEPAARKPASRDPIAAAGRLDTRDILKWGSLSLAAGLVLFVQYLAFNFDQLARTPDWRPLYSSACEMLPCQLPNPSDMSKLRGSSLVVRSHPDVENALVVDAIMFNEASYEQPFPVLELTFSSLRDFPVASRRFVPEEYLHGELAGMETMPRDVPVRVSFEIMDPGDDAVNYRLDFHPAPEKS